MCIVLKSALWDMRRTGNNTRRVISNYANMEWCGSKQQSHSIALFIPPKKTPDPSLRQTMYPKQDRLYILNSNVDKS